MVIGNLYQVGHHILESWQSVFLVGWVLEKSVALFLMGRVGQSFTGAGVVGGVGDSIEKGGGGLAKCGGCWRVSGWDLFSSAMRVLGLSGQW